MRHATVATKCIPRTDWDSGVGTVASLRGDESAASGPLGAALQPERRLMMAVLEDAIRVLLDHRVRFDGRVPTLVLECQEWIAGDDRDWPYSFVNICEALNLDVDRTRKLVGRRRRELDATRGAQEEPLDLSGWRDRKALRSFTDRSFASTRCETWRRPRHWRVYSL
jgi:hypothetical protein